MMASTATSAAATSNRSRGNPKQLILTMDRLVWIRRNRSNENSSANDAISNNANANHYWWPAVYCDSHNQAMREFQPRMTAPSKMKAAFQVLREKRLGVTVPVAVPLMGRDQPVAHLQVVDNATTESEYLRRDFLGASYLMEFSEQNESSENDEAYRACLQELEELIEQALLGNQEPSSSSSSVAALSAAALSAAAPSAAPSAAVPSAAVAAAAAAAAPVPSSQTVSATLESVPVAAEPPTSRLAQPAPVEEQDTIVAVELFSEQEVRSEHQEQPVEQEQDDYLMDNNDQVQQDDNANDDDVDDVDDDSDAIPSNRLAISWDTFWGDMECICGWSLRTGGRPYLYIKPGRNTRPGESKVGVDFFDNKVDVQAYARERYGWRGNDHDDDDQDDDDDSMGSVSTTQTPPNQRTQPQDPGLPLYSSDHSSSGSGGDASDDDSNSNSNINNYSTDESSAEPDLRYEWKPLIKRLLKAGWTYAKTPAGSLGPSWVFLRPGRNYKTGTVGIDYFLTDKDVIAYHQREDAKEEEQCRQQQRKRKAEKSSSHDDSNNNGTKSKKVKKATKFKSKSKSRSTTAKSVVSIGTKSVASAHTTKSAATAKSSKSATSTSNKQTKAAKSTAAKSVASKKRAAATPAKGEKKRQRESTKSATVPRTNTKQQESKSKKNKGQWWKEHAVPTFHAVWPALVKLGFFESDDGYRLPENVCYEDGTSVTFKSSTGLRKFLCWKGIPNYDVSKLESEENTLMQRWVRFANVRVSSRDSVEKLQNISSPKKDDSVKRLLVVDHGWATYDGKLCIPKADEQATERRRVENVHYFKEDNHDAIRCYVRGAWHLISSSLPSDGADAITPPKKRIVSETKELELSIYAATSSRPLPEFTELPPKDDFAVLQKMEEEEEEEHQAERDSDSESNYSFEAPSVEEKEVNLIPPEEDTPCKEAVEAARPPKKKKVDRRPWYMKEPIPSFMQIWPTLQSFGFKWGQSYSHPLIVGMAFSVDSLRKYICRHGIPNYEEDKDNVDVADRERLYRWVVFANVPVSENNSMSKLENVKIPSDKKIIDMLLKLGFRMLDNCFFPPGADSIAGCRAKRTEGIHFHRGLEGIRVFVRENEDFFIGDAGSTDRPSKKRGKVPTITEDQFLPVRFWAALSDAPLATFKPALLDTKVPAETDEESAVKSQEQEPQEDEGEPQEDSEDAENQRNHAALCSQQEPAEDAQDEEMISSEAVEESDYPPNDAPLCSQREPEEAPEDAEMDSSEDNDEGVFQPNEIVLQPNEEKLCSQREPEEGPQDGEMDAGAGLEESEIQCSEDSIAIATNPQEDEMDTETSQETANIEAHDSDAPEEEKTDAETNSKEETLCETEMLPQDETFECERDQDTDNQQDHTFPMTQPFCEEDDSEDEDNEEKLDSPAHPGPLMKFFVESYEYATGTSTRRVTAGPADSASPLEHDWESREGKPESITKGWPVSDHLGHSRFGDYSYTSQSKSLRGTDSAISEHARVSLAPSEDRGVSDSLGGGWGFATQAEDDEEYV